MRIALYYPWIYLTSGAERVLLQLTGRSRHEWTLFTSRFQPESTFPEFRGRHVVQLGEVPVERSIKSVLQSAASIFTRRLPLENYDALVIVCEGLGDMVVFRNHSVPVINVCLTPLRIAFDDAYRAVYAARQGTLARAAVWLGCKVFALIDRIAWRYYRHVFCISEECLKRVRAGRLGRADNQEVLHVGIGIEPESPSGIFEKFFLVPGRIMWTKNLELAVEAFTRFRAMDSKFLAFRLVIAGIVDEKSKPYLAKLRGLAEATPGIEFKVFPSDDELARLYASCYGMLFTAFNEDWGIVPIEAMAFGKPVVSVNKGGPLETVEHGVQGFLEPPDPERFAARMAQLASDEDMARTMGSAGPARSRKYSWDAFAGAVDSKLEQIVPASRRPLNAPLTGPVDAGQLEDGR